jgi:hypothetical protein
MISRPVRIWTDSRGQSARFILPDLLYSGRIVNRWRLQDRWWDADWFRDRTSYRRVTCDHHAFDPLRDHAGDGGCILDRIHD